MPIVAGGREAGEAVSSVGSEDVTTLPTVSLPAQYADVGHEMEFNDVEPIPSISDECAQTVPLRVTTLPIESTAAQNVAEGHDIEFSEFDPSIASAADQVVPLKV